jgi:hypothetical protein
MRLAATAVVAAALAGLLAACVSVDPEDAAERTIAGGALGATLGAGLGATVAINPLLGSGLGAKAGAEIGAAIGAASTPPAPSYKAIAVPAQAVVPGFYDNWPPGYHLPPLNPEAQPPHEG